MTSFIAIISGKGGVGKTTTTINLGCALTNFGRDVLLMDANLQTPHLALNLGSPKLPHSLNDVLQGRKNIRDAAFLHPSGLKLIPASIHIDSMKSTSLKNLNDVLLHLIGMTEIVLLDTGAGFGSDFTAAVTAARQAIVITNPELPAVADAMKAIEIAESCGAKVLGVVINRVRNDKVEMTSKNISVLLGRPIIGIIPEDDHARVALSLKQPLVQSHPESPASIAFKQLAASLTGQPYQPSLPDKQEHSEKPSEHASFFSSILKRLQGEEVIV